MCAHIKRKAAIAIQHGYVLNIDICRGQRSQLYSNIYKPFFFLTCVDFISADSVYHPGHRHVHHLSGDSRCPTR